MPFRVYTPHRRLAGKCSDGKNGEGKKVLAITRSAPFAKLLGLEKADILETDFPDVNMLALPYENESFDYVVSEFVIEHIQGNVQQAIDECYRVLKPGGIAVHTTNFAYPVHGSPYDFWRFTTHALKYLHRDWTEILEADGWGNHYVIALRILDLFFVNVPECRWHPLHRIAVRNDPDLPLVTWIIAKK